ncbi:MAG TPA: M56 family metallopeptidase [Gemmatimonadaceae bacterium]|nr:M56 family metallopeptidase [Gemmatimonadaceae bacterium]
MAVLCLLYFVAFGAVASAAGSLLERALPARAPRRWLWSAILVVSVVVPMLTSVYHHAAAVAVLGQRVLALPSIAPGGTVGGLRLDPGWLHCDSPLGAMVMQGWLGSILVLALLGLGDAWRLSRRLRRARVHGTRQVDGVPVLVTPTLGPATVGFWRARIVLPRWVLALPAAQRRYVVRHEEEHRRAHDARLLGAASILVALMPWNVALWWQLRRLRLAVELDCDRRVVAALGDAPAYGALLLRVAEAASRGPRLQPALTGRLGMLERRLVALVAPMRQPASLRWLALALAAGLLATLLSVPHPLPQPAPAVSRPAAAGHAH